MKGKHILIIGVLLALLLGGGGLYYYFTHKSDEDNNHISDHYSEKAISVIKKMEETDKFQSYSQTVDKMLSSGQFKEEFIQEYFAIDYVEKDDFVKLVNALLEKKYNANEINAAFASLNDKNLIKLEKNEYVNFLPYKDYKNMDVDNIKRYDAYLKKNKMDVQTAVTWVNIGLDQEFYSSYDTIENPDSITVLVNKYHKLPDDYVPSDLVSLSYSSNYKLRKEAALHLEELFATAKKEGHIIHPYSPYRSYETQKSLYTRYSQKDGAKIADTYSARPGFSEHQTGLTCDIRSNNLVDDLNEEDYAWVKENAHKFGFIIRYPNETLQITGYKNEPWHLRYLGKDVATDVYEKNITFDEYYDLYLK